MGDYEAIADVGETLVSLLQDRMETLVDRDEVALASPDDVGGGNDWRLTLYLYRVTGNEHLRNGERGPRDPDPSVSRGTPLALDLHYLLTAHPSRGGSDGTAKTREQHSVLGRAMQVLHDNAIVRGSALKGSLAGDEDLHLSIESESMDAVVNMWGTFPEEPFQPSVAYVVSPVEIESTVEEPTGRVLEREVGEYSVTPEAPDGE